jgi:hypothetical protein
MKVSWQIRCPSMLRDYHVDAATPERDLLRLASEFCANGISVALDPSASR